MTHKNDDEQTLVIKLGVEIAKMIYEAWEIPELITNFAYEGNEKRKR